ncbi:MAG: triose-phosphate isomerase [Pseudomonadota bacterium]
MRMLIAGNWKMNGLSAASSEIEQLIRHFDGATPERIDVLICPPATLLSSFASQYSDEGLTFGGQDCHVKEAGAHTGDISADMLADAGASFVIVGHSERRADHNETDALVKQKATAALSAGLTPIVCVGETEAERDDGRAEEVVAKQLDGSLPDGSGLVVAYEPVWAIGTGRTPTVEDVDAMHGRIRSIVGEKIRILYGGSVKPGNAVDLLSRRDVDGALVGGASLKATDFAAIIDAAP